MNPGASARTAVALVRSRPMRWAFGLLALGLAGWAVAAERAEVLRAVRGLAPGWLVLALAATFVNVLLAGVVWRTVLADLGSPLPWGPATRVFFVGQLGKYVPGSVWPVVVASELGHDHHVPRHRTATASSIGLLLSLASALIVVLLALPFAPVVPSGFAWAVVLVVPLAVMLHPRVLGPVADRGLRALGRPPLDQRASGRGMALAALLAIGSWLGAGVQVWALVMALGGSGGPRTVPLAIGGYALAWAVGFVVVVAPAGAGAREVALAAVLSGVLDRGAIVVVVLLSRVGFTLVDVLMAGLGTVVGRPPDAASAELPGVEDEPAGVA